MDDIVRQAIAKWPNVPDCYGWLGLDARGDWYMRDDRTQAAGPFPRVKGSVLRHEKLIEFIHRNYEQDVQGRWFFQNGPQKVFVELEVAPFIWRVDNNAAVRSTSGQVARVDHAVLDEFGRLYLATDIGFGLVHTMDMLHAASAVEAGQWSPEDVAFDGLPGRYAFVRSPAVAQLES